MSRAEKTIATLVTVPVAAVTLMTIAWGFSYWRMGDRVASNVTVAGVEVGGLSPEALDAKLDELSAEVSSIPVEIQTPEAELEATATTIGLSLDQPATRRLVMAVGRDGKLVTRPFRWVASLFSTSHVDAVVHTDGETLAGSMVEIEGDRHEEPVEPRMDLSGERAVLVEGRAGVSLTLGDVMRALPSRLPDTGDAIHIAVEPTEIPTKVSNAEMQEVVDSANRIIDTTLEVRWADRSAEIPGGDFRGAMAPTTDGDGIRLSLDTSQVEDVLTMHTYPGGNPSGIKFDIIDGVPTPVGGSDVQACCGDDAAETVTKALLNGEDSVELSTRTITAEESRKWAAGLGVKEVIGEFTTRHACCQSRVTNIHRIADIMRGVLIAPGDTISVNGIVGRRTTAKGFVAGGVILDGEHTTDVGGGVSQFATTTFNAAFFAGLDIPAYQSHSEWLSRYPYGRDATLWYPNVDLKIRNNTPYGVMVWTSYTGTSVTVQMWSTPYVKGEQVAQSPTSGCGRITTTRKRTWTDGRTETDRFYANYRC